MSVTTSHRRSAYTADRAAPPPPMTSPGRPAQAPRSVGGVFCTKASRTPTTSVLAPMSSRRPLRGSVRMKTVLQAPTSRHSGVISSKCGRMATLLGIVTDAPGLLSAGAGLDTTRGHDQREEFNVTVELRMAREFEEMRDVCRVEPDLGPSQGELAVDDFMEDRGQRCIQVLPEEVPVSV